MPPYKLSGGANQTRDPLPEQVLELDADLVMEISNSVLSVPPNNGQLGFNSSGPLMVPNRGLEGNSDIIMTVADNNWAGVFKVPMNLEGHNFNNWMIEAVVGGYYMHQRGPVFKIVDMWRDADYLYARTDKVGQAAWGTIGLLGAAGCAGISPHNDCYP